MCAEPLKEGRNFFALFGLKTQYPLDFVELERRYRRLQQSVHPDRFVSAPAAERLLATQRAGLFNQGFQTLRSPVMRARHLLECRGVEMQGEESRSLGLVDGGAVDGEETEFLLQQMELREHLAELRGAGDRAGLQTLERESGREFAEWEQQFSEAIENNELEEGLRMFRRMQFTERRTREIREALQGAEV